MPVATYSVARYHNTRSLLRSVQSHRFWRFFMSTSATVELKPCPLFIDGKPVLSRGPKDIQYNPATGEAVAEIPRSTAEEISAAVEAAHRAFPAWSKTPVIQRCKVLFKYRQL